MPNDHGRADFVARLDPCQEFDDVMELLSLWPFASGHHPFGRYAAFHRLPDDADLTPFGGRIAREDHRYNRRKVLVIGDGWTLLITRRNDASGHVDVNAVTDDVAVAVVQAILKQDDPPAIVDDKVTIGFWLLDGRGPYRKPRAVGAPPWHEIERNYPRRTAATLEKLMALKEPANGRLMLLHGPPGTGKSTVLRALAREWRAWCKVEFVLDPETFFRESAYLLRALLQEDEQESLTSDDEDNRSWRLLLVEDCDELIKAEAKQATGQGLSRLLNVTDGLVGEGLRVLVCITTNEPLNRLHPAVARPGRCLINLEVPAFPAAEAAAWLGRPVGQEMTLAELLQLRDGGTLQAPPRRARPGQYL